MIGAKNRPRKLPKLSTSVSGGEGGSIKGPLVISLHHRNVEPRGLRGALNEVPIIPRGVTLSDTNFSFSQNFGQTFESGGNAGE